MEGSTIYSVAHPFPFISIDSFTTISLSLGFWGRLAKCCGSAFKAGCCWRSSRCFAQQCYPKQFFRFPASSSCCDVAGHSAIATMDGMCCSEKRYKKLQHCKKPRGARSQYTGWTVGNCQFFIGKTEALRFGHVHGFHGLQCRCICQNCEMDGCNALPYNKAQRGNLATFIQDLDFIGVWGKMRVDGSEIRLTSWYQQ